MMHRRILALLAAITAAATATASDAKAAPRGFGPPQAWVAEAIHLADARSISDGAGVTVAVIDTGTAELPIFAGHLTQGPSYVTGGNLPGEQDHGTAMADLVLQVAPAAHVLAMRVIGGESGAKLRYLDKCPVGAAIKYAVAHGAKVITMSIGSETGPESGYEGCEAIAVERALTAGVTVLAAAGNDGFTAHGFVDGGGDGQDDATFPAAYTGVIAVAASNSAGNRAFFSTVHSYVDVAAPGENIDCVVGDGSLAEISGTSPATPLVAGIAALILSRMPDLAPNQVASAIEHTASHAAHWNQLTGFGVANAAAAVRAAERMRPTTPVQAPVAYSGTAKFGTASHRTGGKQAASQAATATATAAANGGYVHAGVLFAIALFCIAVTVLLLRRGTKPRGPHGRLAGG